MKICPKCEKEKDDSSFYSRSGNRSHQLRSYCSTCERVISTAANRRWRRENPDKARSNDLKKMYGITLDDKKAMLSAQGSKCAACGSPEHNNVRYKDSPTGWHVDHDHITGKVRGLLCEVCNRTIGQAKEDIHRLVTLTAYLVKHQSSSLSELAA